MMLKMKVFALLFIFGATVYSQNNFIVFKVEGAPRLLQNDTIRTVTKGSIIDFTSKLTLHRDDSVLIINEEGNLIKVDDERTYTYNDLYYIAPEKDDSNFTKKYFAYVWNQFTNNRKIRTKGGVVYRVDNNSLMIEPSDSVKIYFPEIKFVWKKDDAVDKTYYFILKNLKTNHITKIGTRNDELRLFVDNVILKRGTNYEWAVSETKYPDLYEVTFYNFELLDNEQFKSLSFEISSITTGLQKLGFASEEIKKMLCEDYKICY